MYFLAQLYLIIVSSNFFQMRDEFEKTGKKSFDDNTSPHDVATLLKEFLRDLPEPLLTNKLYTPLLETQSKHVYVGIMIK